MTNVYAAAALFYIMKVEMLFFSLSCFYDDVPICFRFCFFHNVLVVVVFFAATTVTVCRCRLDGC